MAETEATWTPFEEQVSAWEALFRRRTHDVVLVSEGEHREYVFVLGKLRGYERCAADVQPLVEALRGIVANAVLQGDQRMQNATDIYAVPLDDVEDFRNTLAAWDQRGQS